MSREKRSNLGKRQNGLWPKLKNWALGELPPELEKGITQHSTNMSEWPSSYDKTPLSGDKYANGVCCRTVGEYKAEIEKSKWDSWSG